MTFILKKNVCESVKDDIGRIIPYLAIKVKVSVPACSVAELCRNQLTSRKGYHMDEEDAREGEGSTGFPD